MDKEGYTWKDLDESYWKGFDTAKERMQKIIAMLEAEKAELKTQKIPQLERKIASIRGAHSVDCRKLKARTEQVERLKEQVRAMSKALALNLPEADEKLTRAKEIITALLNVFVGDIPEEDLDVGQIDVREKAEKFLKETE